MKSVTGSAVVFSIFPPSVWSSAWGAAVSHRVPNVVGKASVKPLKCCALPKSPWHSGPLGTLHCPKAEADTRSNVWDTFQWTASQRHCRFFMQTVWLMLWPCGLGQEICVAPDLLYHWKQSAFAWFVSGNAAILTMGLPVIYFEPTHHCFSESLLQHPVHLYGHFTKFSAEFNAKTFRFSTFILLCDEGINYFAL